MTTGRPSLRERRRASRALRKQRRAPRHKRSAKADRAIEAAFLGTFLIALVPLGGALPWGSALVAVPAALTMILASRRCGHSGFELGLKAAVAATLFTAFQALPLPLALVEWLSPARALHATRTALALGEVMPSFAALSFEPQATARHALLLAAITAIASAAASYARTHSPAGMARLVAIAATVPSVIGIAHVVVAAESLFGFYEPVDTSGGVLSPLINDNHMSALAAIGASLWIGLALRAHGPQRTLFGALALVNGCACLLPLSRSGALGLGLGAVGALLAYRRELQAKATRRGLGVVVAGLVVAVLMLASASAVMDGRSGDAMAQSDRERLMLGSRALAMALDHPHVGVGRGAFEPGFAAYHALLTRYTHPENIVLQWATEWGLWLTLGLFFALGVVLKRGWSSDRPSNRLLVVALGALAVHELFDFSTEMAAVALPAAALFGVLSVPRGDVDPRRARWFAPALATAMLLGSASMARHIRTPASTRASLASASPGPELDREVTAAASAHPADPLVALSIARALAAAGDDRGGRWLNRSMELAPEWSAPHALAAHWLLAMGRTGQALTEANAAAARRTGAGRAVRCAVFQRGTERDRERLLEVIADDTVALEALARCNGATERVDAAVLGSGRAHVRAAIRIARRSLEEGNVDEARSALEMAADTDQTSAETIAYANAWLPIDPVRAGALAAALTPQDAASLTLRARAAAAARRPEEAATALSQLRRLRAGDPDELATVALLAAELMRELGDDAAALDHASGALRLRSTPEVARRVFRFAVEAGHRPLALRAADVICAEGRSSQRCTSVLSRARAIE